MSIHEFRRHKLNAKHLGGIERSDGSQCFTIKTSYVRQSKTDRILFQVLNLKINLSKSEETCSERKREAELSSDEIYSLEKQIHQLVTFENDEL